MLLFRNGGRRAKNLWTDAGAGSAIIGYVADDEHDEASFISNEIRRLRDEEGLKSSDVAVFYRTNAQSRSVEDIFIRVGIPYRVVEGFGSMSGARSEMPWLICGHLPTQPTKSHCDEF